MTNGILLTRHNQEIVQWSPDPFPRERVGSGHETSLQSDWSVPNNGIIITIYESCYSGGLDHAEHFCQWLSKFIVYTI